MNIITITKSIIISPLLCLLILTACSSGESPTPIVDCTPSSDMIPDCRFTNPEDMALLPGSQTVFISQYGGMETSKPGSIVSYTLDEKKISFLFPAVLNDDRSWGDQSCAPIDPNLFSPHGLDIEQRADGKWALLVVNHGMRESVEFFEIVSKGNTYGIEWRGCAAGPEGVLFNDVVAATDGGFWVTHTMPKKSQQWSILKSMLGINTGYVFHWNKSQGFEKVVGSDGPFLNGLEKSADEAELFINMYMASEVRKLDLKTGEVTGIAEVSYPDNITWSDDGHLLAASHIDKLNEKLACRELHTGACGFRYAIVSIDPKTMSTTTLFEHRGAPLGGVTVALDIGNDFLLGTFAADRVVRVIRDHNSRAEQ